VTTLFKSLVFSSLLIAPAFAQKDFPEGPAKEHVNKICLQCHEPTQLLNQKRSESDWKTTVGVTVIGLSPDEAEALVTYREKHGDYREWDEMLVVYGVDGRKLEAAKDKMSF
jgi:hypothetical protein